MCLVTDLPAKVEQLCCRHHCASEVPQEVIGETVPGLSGSACFALCLHALGRKAHERADMQAPQPLCVASFS